MKVDLKDKVAVVTGAAMGIGRRTAELLAANGAKVFVADIDEAAARETATAIPGAKGFRMDVSSATEVAAGVDWVVREASRIDILVNNAGINTGKNRVTIDAFAIEEWDRIMAVDLRGLFLVSRSVSAVMLRQGEGRIINISSVLGVVPARLQCAYTTAKAGVAHLTRTMAIELGDRGILTNAIAPGSIVTAGTKALFYNKDAIQAEKAKRMLSHIPVGRAGSVDDIGNAVLFFAAPESSYLNGQVLCVDGGWSAGGFLRDF